MGEARNVVDRVWAATEGHDLPAVRALIDDEIDFRIPGAEVRGAQEFEAFLGAWIEGFPDLRHEVVSAVEEGDRVALELIVRGTHTGTLRSPEGDIPPTGRPVTWHSADHVLVQAGRVASWHVYHDQLEFLEAMGLMPVAAPAGA